MVTGHVNIVIPVFNQEGFIRQAVESALSQTNPNFDVSVVDGQEPSRKHDGLLPRALTTLETTT
jgi:GT2 family glycosyltransferase